jgi:KaiC/GvpD/RAD55 family RecA-like ATPase
MAKKLKKGKPKKKVAKAKAKPKARIKVSAKAAKVARAPAEKMIRTGVKGLDKLLGGGIPLSAPFLLYGSPHCGKKPIIMQLAHMNADKNRPIIFIITDFGVNRWKEIMVKEGWDISHHKNMFFIDCYSTQFGMCPVGENVTCLEVPFALTTLSIECSKFLDEIKETYRQDPIVIIHSLSTLIETFGPDAVYRFLQFFIGKLRNDKVTTIFSMQAGMHGDRTEMMITSLMDGYIEMKDSKIRASGFLSIPSREWFPYKMEREGVVILSK